MKMRIGVIGMLLLFAAFCRAQNTSTFGTITAASGTCTPTSCVYYQVPQDIPWVALTVSGTWSGTLQVQTISGPDATYQNINSQSWTLISTITANGNESVAVGSARLILVNASAFASGAAQIRMSSSQSGTPLSNPVFSGIVTDLGVKAPDGGSSSNCWATNGSQLAGCGGNGISPGAQYHFPEYSGAGTGIALGPSNVVSDSTGNNLTIPGNLNANQLEVLFSGSPNWTFASTSTNLNINYVGAGSSQVVNLANSAFEAISIQGPTGVVRIRPNAGNVDDVTFSATSPAGTNGSGWLQNVDAFGFGNIDFNPESSSTLARPGAEGLVWWLANSGTLGLLVSRPGTGYTGTGTCTLSGGVGSGDTCATALNGTGGITVTLAGSGTYSVPPNIVITGYSTGSGAQAFAFINAPNTVLTSLFMDPAVGKLRFTTGTPAIPITDLFTVDTSGNTSVAGGSNVVLRCTTAGTLPIGALTITAGNCTASTDTGLRVK